MDELFDIASVARYLGVSERTVYDRVRSGELPAVKVGRLWRVRVGELEAWLARSALEMPAPVVAEGGPAPSRADLEEAMAAFADRVERRLAFVAVLTSAVEALGWPGPVVVGGHAVEFYTAGGYATPDIDLIGASEPIAEVLGAWGFARQGRHWFDDALGIVAEVPGSSLTSGECEHVSTLAIAGRAARILGIEDLVIDRLNACVHWGDTESCAWAETLLEAAGDLDLGYLRARAVEESVSERLTEALAKAAKS